jgi:membrane protease subunit HflK
MSEHHHPDPNLAPETRDAGSQALAEALRSSFAIVKVAMAVLVAMIFFAGFFTVKQGEQAVILRFGKPLGEGEQMLLSPGKLYWSFPYPIDQVVRIPISQIQKIDSSAGWYPMTSLQEQALDYDGTEPPPGGNSLDPRQESYVITADTNVIHTRVTVTYHIENPKVAIFGFSRGANHEFNLDGISNAVQNAADNALVATAAGFSVDDILTQHPGAFKEAVTRRIKALVLEEKLGVRIESCQVKSLPIRQLKADFALATQAQENRDKLIQDARGASNKILADSKAQAAIAVTNAATTRFEYVARLRADVSAFTNLLAKFGTNTPLYERMQLAAAMPEILTNSQKFFLPRRQDGKARELRLELNREPAENERTTMNQ